MLPWPRRNFRINLFISCPARAVGVLSCRGGCFFWLLVENEWYSWGLRPQILAEEHFARLQIPPNLPVHEKIRMALYLGGWLVGWVFGLVFVHKAIQNLPPLQQDCPRTFSGLSQDFFRTFSELSQGFLRTFSQSCNTFKYNKGKKD